MSYASPLYNIPRQEIPAGMEGMWVKMWDPPTRSPETPDRLDPTNPVPEVMAAAGHQNAPSQAHTVQRELLHGMKMPTWDGAKELVFMTFRDKDNPATRDGNWPAATLRIPRGVIFHGETSGKGPPPHTIHWHGIEPTPMNDGVGHCSMELGHYVYQWQPNFIGTYFCHCHRNTVQHFEFGLYGLLLIEPADAYFATIRNPSIPIGHCRDGKRRTAANLGGFPQFPAWVGGLLTDPDPQFEYGTNPHAMTVPYDVEALWVLDDRDSVWSDLAPHAFATMPKHGSIPGVNDEFDRNPGKDGFFAFNQFNADYWFVTGVPVPGHKGGIAAIPPGIVIPPALNSGVTGTQVSVEARVGDTILIRCLDAAYNCTTITFPVDVTIIAWDGRALGVPPYGYNHAHTVLAGTPIHTSTARRFDALIKSDVEVHDFATIEFIDTRGQVPGYPETLLMTAKIPINIAAGPAGGTFTVSGMATSGTGATVAGVNVALTGAAIRTAVTDAAGTYEFAGLPNGSYNITPSFPSAAFTPPNANVNVSGADVPGVDFVVAVALGGYTVSGVVTERRKGRAIPGVHMDLIGADGSGVSAVTDAFGNYRFAGLADGRYTAVPFLPGYRFLPREKKVIVRGADVSGRSFEGRKL